MGKSQHPQELEALAEFFKSFPGVGRRGAERMVFGLLKWAPDKARAFGEAIAQLHDKIRRCPECGNWTADGLCRYCASVARDRSRLCVVEEASQILSIEESGLYHGLYHVLGGKLAPLSGKDAADLNLDGLVRRAGNSEVKEVILALGQDVEGQATAYYIAELLKDIPVALSSLARGIPAGADISFANAATMAAAIDGRVPMKKRG